MSTKDNAARTLHHTVITVDVLSDHPFEFDDLEDLHHAITSGDCSGRWVVMHTEQVDGGRMAQLLIGQGSDPDFFGPFEDGEDADYLAAAELLGEFP
jgi:hypothetical protein